jgi:hypothetical protein
LRLLGGGAVRWRPILSLLKKILSLLKKGFRSVRREAKCLVEHEPKRDDARLRVRQLQLVLAFGNPDAQSVERIRNLDLTGQPRRVVGVRAKFQHRRLR